MSEYNKITFKFAKQLGYSGLDNRHSVPNYYPGHIDFVVLLDYLAGNGKQNYQYSKFIGSRHVSGPAGNRYRGSYYTNNNPLVTINGSQVRLEINARLNKRDGVIDLDKFADFHFEIKPNELHERYVLKIPYADSTKPYYLEDYAILISTGDFYHFNFILNVIYDSNSNKEVEDYIFNKFEKAFIAYSRHDRLDFLYEQAPIWVIARRNKNQVFMDLRRLLKSSVDEHDINEEYAVLKIVQSFGSFPSSIPNLNRDRNYLKSKMQYFLDTSISSKFAGKTMFQHLYEKIHDFGGEPNFTAFIQTIYLYWLESNYPFKKYFNTTAPIVLDYKSQKVLGFYSDGKSFTFSNFRINVTFSAAQSYAIWSMTGEYPEDTLANPHIFQTIETSTINQEGVLLFPGKHVPAFYLKAFDDKNAWHNLQKATWLALDILVLFSSIGNLLRLTRLVSVARAPRVLKILASGVEVTSSAVSAMLHFVDSCDKKGTFCSKLRTVLLFIDIGTLSVDTVASSYLRKATLEALDAMSPALRAKHKEIFNELEHIAKTTPLSKLEQDNLIDALKRLGYDGKFLNTSFDLLDNTGGLILRVNQHEVEALISFLQIPKSRIKKIIEEVISAKKAKNDRFVFKPELWDPELPISLRGLCPDYRGTTYLYHPEAVFKVKLLGTRQLDDAQAYKQLFEKFNITDPLEKSIIKKKYTWHHLDDLDENLEYTIQLVESKYHNGGFYHTGAVGIFKTITGFAYKTYKKTR